LINIEKNKEIVQNILNTLESVSIFIELSEFDTVDLENFIQDSLQFISLVVALENEFKIEFPTELLIFDNFKQMNDIYNIINELMYQKGNDEICK